MDADCYEEDGDEAEVDDAVDEDGDPTGLHVRELHHSTLSRQLEK